MSVLGQAVLSAFLQVLFDRLASPELLKFAKQEQVYNEFKKWEKILLKIYAVLDDAEEKQMTNKFVEIWLAELKDLAYDVEDILDEFTTEACTCKPQNFTNSLSSLIPSNFMFKLKMGSKIKGITSRLHEICSQKNDLDLRENGGRVRRVSERLPTTFLVNEAQVYGRENDKEAVVKMLLRNYSVSDSKICVISIIGMGGVGKTTLAQLVYNDARVDEFFDMKVWACVSDDFDVLSITKTVLESVTRGTISSNLNLLQGRLQDMLTDKKFLLVLDDVWNENDHNWDVLCSPFRSGAHGSKILVTTRNEGVASIMGSVSTYRLKELSYDTCLPLFAQLAVGAKNFDGHPSLKAIGEAIVERCKGLPLAAKTLGSLLRTKVGQDEWEDILHSKIWDLPEERNGILPALRLSYHHLPSPLKQCFAYCSIFPKDYEFTKEELVLLWMAEGFLQQPRGTKRMENLGEKYFNDLLSRSLFQQSSSNESRFVMHDLINDLAQYVAGEVCFRLEDHLESTQQKAVDKARHMSYTRSSYEAFKKFKVLYKAQTLRTFLPLPINVPISWRKFYLTRKLIGGLLPRLKCLRVLSFSGYCISSLPDFIGKLKHLRYLNLSHTLIQSLPESICGLWNLQTIILFSCSALSKLPSGIVNLINMRHLDITNTRQLQEMPLQMGKLTNLRTLSKFIVGRTSGSRITELRDMLRLRGRLTITGLHNVTNIFDAMEANLRCKQDLQDLVMKWRSNSELEIDSDDRMETDVLDMLQPHKNLKVLKIEFYAGLMFPGWIADPSFTKLTSLTFKNCKKCTSLPPLGKLPFLEELCIQGMEGVKSIGLEFYGELSTDSTPFKFLKCLTFADMLEWEDWSCVAEEKSFDCEFPLLHELHIRNCPNLIKRLPNFLPVLAKLEICKCPLLAVPLPILPSLCQLNLEECSEVVVGSTANLASLTNLQLQSISNIRQFPERVMQCSPALEVVSIINCNELATLRQIGCQQLPNKLECLELYGCSNLKELCSFTSLTDLRIKRCPKIVTFPEPEFPSMLRRLVIEDCDMLQCLPIGVMTRSNHASSSSADGNASYLESLEIIKCPALVSFPVTELPTSLKVLKIWDCTQLEPLPESMLSNTLSLECLSIRKYTNLRTLPECLHCLTQLIELHISYCVGLESFPERGLPILNLRRLYIFNCQNLNSLPSNIQSLTSLHHLGISSCPGLVSFPEGGLPLNLKSLRISNCKNLPELSEWNLHRLLFLKDLLVSGGSPSLVSFAHDYRLPATLVHLRIEKLLNLESLSGLENLTSLEVLEVTECPKLQSLPKEGLPSTLSVLEILDCPILKRKCLKKKGKYWSMVSNVARLEIDETLIQ